MASRERLLKSGVARVVVGVVAGAFLLAAVIAFVGVSSEWLAATDDIKDPAKRAEEIGRARTAVLAVLAGTLAAIGAYYTHRNFLLSRQGQITERFTRAVDQLGNESTDVRIGGIYALERIARESPADHGPIVDILTAYARQHSPTTPFFARKYPALHVPVGQPQVAVDVQAAVAVVGRRDLSHDPPWPWRLNLTHCSLPGADLADAHLRNADLSHTDLMNANLTSASLEGACLDYAWLAKADLTRADLRRAALMFAWAPQVVLDGAVLEESRVVDVDLSEASCRETAFGTSTLKYVELKGSDLTGASFSSAVLDRVDLSGSQLRDADFSEVARLEVDLSRTNHSDAHWPVGIDLSREDEVCFRGLPGP